MPKQAGGLESADDCVSCSHNYLGRNAAHWRIAVNGHACAIYYDDLGRL